MDASLNLEGRHPFCFRLDSAVIVIVNILGNRLGEGLKGGIILFKSIHIWISPVRCPRRMQSSISSQKTPKYKKLSRKRKTAQYLSILSCFMMECRWWDSNPHGFPNDFESFASAIPPHRLIFNFGTLVPVSEDWRDAQEGCKKSCFDKLSKFNEYSWISCTDMKNHEADFESPSSAIPTHRLICNSKERYYYSGFCAQNQD